MQGEPTLIISIPEFAVRPEAESLACNRTKETCGPAPHPPPPREEKKNHPMCLCVLLKYDGIADPREIPAHEVIVAWRSPPRVGRSPLFIFFFDDLAAGVLSTTGSLFGRRPYLTYILTEIS